MAAMETESWANLGVAMRQARIGTGHTLTEVGRMIGWSKTHLSQVERGLERPSHELVAAYDNAFRADGLLSNLYLVARNPMLGGLPVARSEPGGAEQQAAVLKPATEPTTNELGDSSLFVADITVPNGTVLPSNAEILKIWRLRNVGTVPWIGRTLARVGPYDGAPLLSSPPSVPISDTEPGDEVDIAVLIRTPSAPGTYIATWKMLDAGRLVFPRINDGLNTLIIVAATPGTPAAVRHAT